VYPSNNAGKTVTFVDLTPGSEKTLSFVLGDSSRQTLTFEGWEGITSFKITSEDEVSGDAIDNLVFTVSDTGGDTGGEPPAPPVPPVEPPAPPAPPPSPNEPVVVDEVEQTVDGVTIKNQTVVLADGSTSERVVINPISAERQEDSTTPQQLSLNADNYDEIAISVSNQLDDFIQRLRTPLAANDSTGVIQAALLQSVQTLLSDEAGQQALADLVINQQACNSGEANTDNTGDEVRYQFNACVKNGYTFNGELSSQHTPGSAQARLSYRTFKAEDGEGEAITLVGDKTLTLTMESANQRVRSEVSAGDLVASNAQGRSTQRQGYTLDYTRIGTEWRLSVNGTVQLTTSKTPRCS
jgi:hypothetical protein